MKPLADFLDRAQQLVALTGAGCSTESGIPDYRSPGGVWTAHKPVYYNEFMRSEEVRRFYWARSYRNWPRFVAARPNAAHHALAELEARGRLDFLITQNVDDLHQEGGSRNIVQLHGRNRVVVCLDCRSEFRREQIQDRLAHIPVPECELCGGILKPDVVFFGENVPQAKVRLAMQRVDQADALLVVGSSLTVWSGFRFVKRAAERALPIAIVNIGPTRGDGLARLKIEENCSRALSAAIRRLPMSQNPEPSESNIALGRL